MKHGKNHARIMNHFPNKHQQRRMLSGITLKIRSNFPKDNEKPHSNNFFSIEITASFLAKHL